MDATLRGAAVLRVEPTLETAVALCQPYAEVGAQQLVQVLDAACRLGREPSAAAAQLAQVFAEALRRLRRQNDRFGASAFLSRQPKYETLAQLLGSQIARPSSPVRAYQGIVDSFDVFPCCYDAHRISCYLLSQLDEFAEMLRGCGEPRKVLAYCIFSGWALQAFVQLLRRGLFAEEVRQTCALFGEFGVRDTASLMLGYL